MILAELVNMPISETFLSSWNYISSACAHCPCRTDVWDEILIHEIEKPPRDERFASLESIV